MSRRRDLAGGLILLGLLVQILSFLPALELTRFASYTLWLATALLWFDIPRRTRQQSGVLLVLGVGFLVLAAWRHGAEVDWAGSLTGNVYVVAMLLGVSFVGLIGGQATPVADRTAERTGAGALFRTWLGVHVLGIVLNLSTVFMVGDRLARQGELRVPQLLMLNRGLSSAALWSPFFASMGVVLTLAPDMQYSRILIVGLPLAACAGLIAIVDLRRQFDLSTVTGFSLAPRSLLMPVAMAVLVLLFYQVITPGLGIVSIITFLMPATALASQLVSGPRRARRQLTSHVRQRLPMMRGEISLFLAAGLLTLGLSTYVEALTGSQWTLFARFGTLEAMASLVAIVVSAVLGLHPIIGISVLASMLQLSAQEQTLFAFVALGAWAIGTSVGPLSGINLSLQGRYGISGFVMMRHNLVYALSLLVLVLAAIALTGRWG
ncbi:hypothetical protein E4656_10330 [Natronospirillum operosum]|uniref:Permease n=1 Tax=Natronospirillum operosum TaxID=2759953 RepID=A0A4Z0W9H3_9GAMM|nr:hypothetical protein E4656_10330 [Natronospirillum operosum]